METVKDYYKILGIAHDASLFQIEQAYQKGALQWHPDKNKGNRAEAQRRFHDVSEAYQVLSDNNKRYKFDQILHKGYALDDANKTFQSFFNQHDFIDEQEHNFFNKNFPQRKKTSYEVLGVPKNASLNQIKTAYRKLAIKHHPTNFNNSKQSQEKFVQINKAYQDLADPLKREVYDNWLYGQIAPIKAHNIFEDFYRNRDFEIPHQEEFFKPLLKKKWSFGLDKMMNDQDDFGKISNGQTWKESTVYSNDNGIQTKKNIRRSRRVVNGIAEQVKTEDYLLPNGQRQLIRTIQSNGKVQTKKYCFRKGQNPPKQLLN